MKEKTNGRTNE